MLLKSLSAENSRGSVLELPLEISSGGYLVKSIDGLGPVKASVVSSSFANLDGSQYHTSRLGERNIVLQLGLEPDYSQESVFHLRNRLYDFFMPKSSVKLKFNLYDKFEDNILLANLMVEIEGRVESNDPSIFSKDPANDVSILCMNPLFVDPEQIIFEGFTVDDTTETVLDYKGNVETGVLFRISPDRAMAGFTIYHSTPGNELRTTYFNGALESGEVVEINSVRGEKSVMHTTILGVESSALYSMTPQSNWLELVPGENYIRVYSDDGTPVPYAIEYTNKYGGL